MDINWAFKLFDIRGKYPEVVDERLAFIVSTALDDIYRPKKVLLAADRRASSPRLAAYLADGFSEGVEIYDLGEVAVPQFYFSAATLGFDIGIMVTASHMEGTDNGFKIISQRGLPLDEGEIISLKNHCQKIRPPAIVRPRRKATKLTTTKEYLRALEKFINLEKTRLKICCDFNVSAAEPVLRKLFGDLKIQVEAVAEKKVPGNPLLLETRAELAALVKKTKSDLGIIWDSDADRVIFVDEEGKLIPPTFILAILGKYIISDDPDKKVVVDVRAGLAVRDVIREAGGKLTVVPAWHQFIQFAMDKDPEIAFGGETTGHIFFRDFFTIDDGAAAAFKFIEAISLPENRDILKSIKNRYFEIPEANFPCPFEKSVLVLSKLSDYYRNREFLVSVIDGVTVYGPDWKFNLRQSATEPYLRLNVEAATSAQAEKIYEQIDRVV